VKRKRKRKEIGELDLPFRLPVAKKKKRTQKKQTTKKI